MNFVQLFSAPECPQISLAIVCDETGVGCEKKKKKYIILRVLRAVAIRAKIAIR